MSAGRQYDDGTFSAWDMWYADDSSPIICADGVMLNGTFHDGLITCDGLYLGPPPAPRTPPPLAPKISPPTILLRPR
jgi:hypothetical protein